MGFALLFVQTWDIEAPEKALPKAVDQVLFVAGEQLHMATLSVESQHIANINILREKKAAPFFFTGLWSALIKTSCYCWIKK